jgi:hypothetical protein
LILAIVELEARTILTIGYLLMRPPLTSSDDVV